MTTLKLKTKVNFPATVTATGGIGIEKVNGVWTVHPDWSGLLQQTTLASPSTWEIWSHDTVNNLYYRITVQAFINSLPAGPTGATGATGAGYGGTSATSFLIGTGSKAFTTQAGLAYVVGSRVRAASAANGANYMEGLVTAYSTTTLTINVTATGGSGTLSDWNLSIAGQPGAGSGDMLAANNLSDVANKHTSFDNLSIHGADVASASTVNLDTATGHIVDVTGTTTITAVTLSDGKERVVRFTGALTLTNGASLVLPGGANITTAAGDFARFVGYAAGVVRCAIYQKASGAAVVSGSGVSSLNGANGALVSYFPPQGRVTALTAVPVPTTSQAGVTTIYYTPYCGNLVPIYDGTNMVPTVFAEISQATTDATKSPAAATTNSNYDVFVWSDSGTIRATRGPPWTSDTARGSGAGTTELQLVNGIYLNKNAITNGPAANRGTYVGTIRTNGSSTVDYIFGSVGAGGVAAVLNVWNAYNRVTTSTTVRDSTDTWTYAVANTWRQANGSATAKVSFIRGLDEDAVQATYWAGGNAGASTVMKCGVGVDSVTAFTGKTGLSNSVATADLTAHYSGTPGLGFHYVAPIEINSTTTASTWYGDLGLTDYQSSFPVTLRN